LRSKALTFWLAFFLGFLGIHRFYLGKPLTGLLWFFTSGLFSFGYLFDVIFIAFNLMRDGQGQKLRPPGLIHDLIIKVMAILLLFSVISFFYFIINLALTEPSHPIFQELPDFPGAIDV